MLHLSAQAQNRSFAAPAAPGQSGALSPSRTTWTGRSRSRNQRDNNFAGARASAVLSPGYGSRAVVFNGQVGRRDPIDFFKVTLLPNASISSLVANRQTIRQASLNFRMIGDIQGRKLTLIGANFVVSDLPPASYPVQPTLVNRTGEPIDFYFRFAAVGRRESRYNLAFSFFQ